MIDKSFLDRIAKIEDLRRIQEREDVPFYDLSGLTQGQREQIRDGARIVMALRKGSLALTDERLSIIREAERLLYSCPKVKR